MARPIVDVSNTQVFGGQHEWPGQQQQNVDRPSQQRPSEREEEQVSVGNMLMNNLQRADNQPNLDFLNSVPDPSDSFGRGMYAQRAMDALSAQTLG